MKKLKKKEAEDKMIYDKEIGNFESLINQSDKWHKSQSLRRYLDEVEINAINKNILNKELVSWLKWARQKADWYDPLVEIEDDIFKNTPRDQL